MSSPKLNSNKNGYVTSKSKIIAFKKTGDISEDPLTELLRTGARQLICCLLQIGYFKAKQTFFRFSLEDIPQEEVAFALQRYFQGMAFVTSR
jgi:hypothetical protein